MMGLLASFGAIPLSPMMTTEVEMIDAFYTHSRNSSGELDDPYTLTADPAPPPPTVCSPACHPMRSRCSSSLRCTRRMLPLLLYRRLPAKLSLAYLFSWHHPAVIGAPRKRQPSQLGLACSWTSSFSALRC